MRPLYFTIVLPHGPIILYDEGYIFSGKCVPLMTISRKKAIRVSHEKKNLYGTMIRRP